MTSEADALTRSSGKLAIMNLDWLPPLLAGATISAAVGAVTGIFRRKVTLSDRKAEVGHEAARLFLEDLIEMRGTMATASTPSGLDSYKFDADLVARAESHALLLTDKRLRETAEYAMRTIDSIGPAKTALSDGPAPTQRKVINILSDATAAFLRHDALPKKRLDYVDQFNKEVSEVWDSLFAPK